MGKYSSSDYWWKCKFSRHWPTAETSDYLMAVDGTRTQMASFIDGQSASIFINDMSLFRTAPPPVHSRHFSIHPVYTSQVAVGSPALQAEQRHFQPCDLNHVLVARCRAPCIVSAPVSCAVKVPRLPKTYRIPMKVVIPPSFRVI